jgi:hypothetical protein
MVFMTDTVPAMSAEEHRAYDAGRKAHADGVDYFDGPYMHGLGPTGLNCAWSLGWFDAQDGVTVEQRFAEGE